MVTFVPVRFRLAVLGNFIGVYRVGGSVRSAGSMGAKKLSIRMRDECFKMVLEAGMPSFYSGYAEV